MLEYRNSFFPYPIIVEVNFRVGSVFFYFNINSQHFFSKPKHKNAKWKIEDEERGKSGVFLSDGAQLATSVTKASCQSTKKEEEKK